MGFGGGAPVRVFTFPVFRFLQGPQFVGNLWDSLSVTTNQRVIARRRAISSAMVVAFDDQQLSQCGLPALRIDAFEKVA